MAHKGISSDGAVKKAKQAAAKRGWHWEEPTIHRRRLDAVLVASSTDAQGQYIAAVVDRVTGRLRSIDRNSI